MVEFGLWQPPEDAVSLWEGGAPGFRAEYGQPQPTITPYRVQSERAVGAVVVLPGGGYGVKAAHEAGPVAEWLNGLGLAAFVVDYRVAPYRHPIPLMDARRAVQMVRCRAAEWGVDPAKVAVLGFSAGGHLAATTATHFEPITDPAPAGDAVDGFRFRPDAVILCYPVISFGPWGHVGSMENLLGPNPPEDQRAALSNENRVTAETPPAFLWHTANDQTVPVANSLLFARALAEKGIPFELHVFADGVHGVGLAQGHPSAEPWTALCARWLRNLGF